MSRSVISLETSVNSDSLLIRNRHFSQDVNQYLSIVIASIHSARGVRQCIFLVPSEVVILREASVDLGLVFVKGRRSARGVWKYWPIFQPKSSCHSRRLSLQATHSSETVISLEASVNLGSSFSKSRHFARGVCQHWPITHRKYLCCSRRLSNSPPSGRPRAAEVEVGAGR